MPSVLTVDNSLLSRQGLKEVLVQEYRDLIFAGAKDAAGALAQTAKSSWDLLVVDVNLSSQDGFGLLREIRKRHPLIPVLMMSTSAEYVHALRAKQEGAVGYIGKDATRGDLLKAIRKVMSGKTYFEGFQLPESGEESLPKICSLSPREYRVMLALGNGKRATDIAAELNLSIKTVSTYKRRILNKLRIDSTAQLVRHVIQNKLS